MRRLYRWVSAAEAADMESRCAFRGVNAEGKWLAETSTDAQTWGQALDAIDGGEPGVLVEIDLPDSVFNALDFLGPHLDGIGPGYFGSCAVLNQRGVRVWCRGRVIATMEEDA